MILPNLPPIAFDSAVARLDSPVRVTVESAISSVILSGIFIVSNDLIACANCPAVVPKLVRAPARLLADVLNDIGMTIDMALPILLSQTWMTSPLTTLYPAVISEYLPLCCLV